MYHVTSTPPPGVDERRAEVTTWVRGTQGDVEMEEAAHGGSGNAQDKAEIESAIAPCESGIARAAIASERRPHPTEGWVETEIEGKKFKLGGPLSEDARWQIRQMKFLIVAIEYFTKWVEAEPVAQITAHKVQQFVWKNVVCRFGVPKRLVSDNGTQFTSHQLRNLCEEVGIQQVFASVEHPQTNGQVESANRVLLRGLKRRLEKAKGTWAEEVPKIVWAYHTTPQSSTHETPFSRVGSSFTGDDCPHDPRLASCDRAFSLNFILGISRAPEHRFLHLHVTPRASYQRCDLCSPLIHSRRRRRSNMAHIPPLLEAVLVTATGFLLIRFNGDHHPLHRWQLQLQVPR